MKLDSILNDNRGEILLITGFKQYPECTMFITKAGYARGGCIHRINDEFVCVIEGNIEYICYTPTGMSRTKMFAGDTVKVPKNTPHYYISWSDSAVLEWGATPEEKKEKHADFRAIVDEINSRNLLKHLNTNKI